MKLFVPVIALFFVPFSLLAQTKTTTKPVAKTGVKTTKPAPKPVIVPAQLKNLSDSAGYALGVDVASSLLAQKMNKINRGLISQALNDALDGKPGLIDENSSFMVLNGYSNKCREEEELRKAGKPIPKVVKPAVAPKGVLKTLADSAGYALGVNIGTSLKFQEMTDINRALISRGLNDHMTGKPTVISPDKCNEVLMKYGSENARKKAEKVIEAGQAFLEKNKLRPEVKTTATGLQYEVLTEGTGIKPAVADTFVVHYIGSLVDGTQFESSYERNTPLTYPVAAVIPGWTEGLQLMGVGSKYRLYIPYNLGYGLRGNPPVIPGGSTLIFEMELLDVKKAQ